MRINEPLLVDVISLGAAILHKLNYKHSDGAQQNRMHVTTLVKSEFQDKPNDEKNRCRDPKSLKTEIRKDAQACSEGTAVTFKGFR